jgi:hypothetical protein
LAELICFATPHLECTEKREIAIEVTDRTEFVRGGKAVMHNSGITAPKHVLASCTHLMTGVQRQEMYRDRIQANKT